MHHGKSPSSLRGSFFGSGSPNSVLSMRFMKKESLKANWVWVLKCLLSVGVIWCYKVFKVRLGLIDSFKSHCTWEEGFKFSSEFNKQLINRSQVWSRSLFNVTGEFWSRSIVLRLVSIGSRNQEHGYLGHKFMLQALVIVYSQIISIFLKDTKREITDNRWWAANRNQKASGNLITHVVLLDAEQLQ